MEVHFTPEQEAQIEKIAADAGTDAEQPVKRTVMHLRQTEIPRSPSTSPLPAWDLGAIGSLRRCDLHDDRR